MSIRVFIVVGAASVFALCLPIVANSQVSGEAVFNARCKSCHDPAVERAPGRTELAIRPRADIEKSLTSGLMVPMAQGMSTSEIQAVASFLTNAAPAAANAPGGRRPGTPAVGVDRLCASHPPIQAADGDWSTFGISSASDRFQRRPGLSASDVPKLKVKWAFTMPGG